MLIANSTNRSVFPFCQKQYKLLDKDGNQYNSAEPGTIGGNKKIKIYGRLDCPSALGWIEKGKLNCKDYYVKDRVFFKDEKVAIQAGYRPCARCLKEEYNEWKQNPEEFKQNKLSVLA